MRILVTNDDGIDSVGLHVLARALVRLGDVVVVAPDREFSGCGAALGTMETMHPEVHRSTIDGVPESYAVSGPPGLCVFFARMGVFGDIDLVVSGINPGANTGRAIYHSGTVGAALTARIGGISGVAVSQSVTGGGIEGQGWDEMLENQRWDTAAEIGALVAESLLADLPETPAVVNVNVPNCAVDEIAGWTHAEVGALPVRAVESARLEPKQGHEDAYDVVMEWGEPADLPPETDGGAVRRDLVAVTFLSAFRHEPRPDLASVDRALDARLP